MAEVLTFNFRTDQAKAETAQAIFEGVQEVFELDIKPEAQANSPVSPEYPSIPEARGEKRIDHGTNRRSIDTEVIQTPEGPQATMFSQSGHGGYLEVGTSKMPARPYMYPAAQKFFKKISDVIREKIAGIRG